MQAVQKKRYKKRKWWKSRRKSIGCRKRSRRKSRMKSEC